MKYFTTRKITTGMLFVIMVLSIFFSTGVFAANDVQTEAVKRLWCLALNLFDLTY